MTFIPPSPRPAAPRATAAGVVTCQSRPRPFFFSEEDVLVQHSREEVVDLLRRAGLSEVADKATEELPERVSLEDVEDWGVRHGVTRDMLISQMGGSP